jgi:hypothetical protein
MRKIDAKYHIENDQIVNTKTGEILPEDEPLILFRGKDNLVRALMGCYWELCDEAGCPPQHMMLIGITKRGFQDFAIHYPGRMKRPD